MELITDRTEADALLQNTKGRYSYRDLNRVEQAVETLCGLAEQLDISLGLTVKTDWAPPTAFSADNWPVESQMARYLANVKQLCKQFSINMPLPTTMSNLTWEGANNIEKALQAVYDHLQSLFKLTAH